MHRNHGDGGIDEHGPDRWRLRWRAAGTRHSKIFRGSVTAARKELRRLIKSVDDGLHVAPAKLTIADYLSDWLANDTRISPKTRERYQQLARRQINPYLGSAEIQKLRPADVNRWHSALLKTGLAARTVGHAHRVLHRGLGRAVALELASRNVAYAVSPPKVDQAEVKILTPEQVAEVRTKLADHPLGPVAEVALGSGMRRGEICALIWSAVDLTTGVVQVARSMEETAAGLRTKEPKTARGRRSIALPKVAAEALREQYRRQLAQRLAIGIGRPGDDDYVFPKPTSPEFAPWPPDQLSRDWARVVGGRQLPRVSFHALRHTHASTLIAAGVDILSISRRLGHGRASVTLDVYGHLVKRNENEIMAALDAALGSL